MAGSVLVESGTFFMNRDMLLKVPGIMMKVTVTGIILMKATR